MILDIVAKLLGLCICSIAVNGLDGISNEDVNGDRIDRLSNQINNLKNLHDPSPRYYNYNPRQSFLPNIYNRENDYNIYLKQYYIEPILESLKEILERVNIKTTGYNIPQPFYGQIPGQFANSYGSGHGIVGGWGVSTPLMSQSHGVVGDSGQSLFFPLNENTNNNDTATPQPFGVNEPSPTPLSNQNHDFGTGHVLSFASGQSNNVASGQGPNLDTHAKGQGFSVGSGSYSSSNKRLGVSLDSNLVQSHGLSPITAGNTQGQKSSTIFSSGSSTQSYGFSSDFGSKAPPNTQTNRFDFGLGPNLPSYHQAHKFGNAPPNKQYNDNWYWPSIPTRPVPNFGSQSSYANTGPNIINRFPADDDDDTARNWGIVEEKDNDKYNVPKSLKSKSNTPSNCASEANNNKNAKSSPIQLSSTSPKTAITCKAAVLSCCIPGTNEQERRDCFDSQGCVRSYDTGLACLPVVIRAVYKELYENL